MHSLSFISGLVLAGLLSKELSYNELRHHVDQFQLQQTVPTLDGSNLKGRTYAALVGT